MSGSDTENGAKGKTPIKISKFQLKKLCDIKMLEETELWAYIEKLHYLLKKNEKKIRKYKDQIKKLLKPADQRKTIADAVEPEVERCKAAVAKPTATETTSETIDAAEETHAAAVCSFVDEIRQAAEQAQNLNGFVYEPTSGLYYDQKTGYYYNAEYGLYYDGNTGCYYNYNQEKNAFEFHSQVQVPAKQKTSENANDDKKTFANYADGGVGDVADDEVEFDEWGVITDKEKLRRIKEEKQLQEKQKRSNKRKKRKTDKSYRRKKHAHRAKRKRKRTRRNSESADSARASDDCESARGRRAKVKRARDIEDGELSSSSSSSSSSCSRSSSGSSDSDCSESSASDCEADGKDGENVPNFASGSRFQDIAKKYPPSLRIVVQETNLDALKVGNLSLITYKGGSLGREGKHDVIIPDVNVSKTHLKFNYDTKQSVYKCVDLGSRNGTVLNGVRMSASKKQSVAHDLVHGSVLQIAQTRLLCHVHEGNSTCGLCEPGLLIEPVRETAAPAAPAVVLSHKEQLKKLQKKYGLENEKFVNGKQNAPNYNDRAATRRIQVGSSTDGEKTQTASVNTEISSENKGFKMLSKLGWNKGETLGKSTASAGLLEPINVASNEGKRGLGCDEQGVTSVPLTIADKRRIDACKKMQERYQKADIFADSDDSS